MTTGFDGLRAGLVGVRECIVTDAMTTKHAGHPVFTTPHMIMLMEDTAQETVRPYLGRDHTTVGYEVNVRHRAATPLGMRVTVKAELIEVDGRRLVFRVEARNERELIGEGTHRRTIVPIGAIGR
jgi:fluoroacetyl-CoA thioesterase